jgi:hypothetical protein
LLKTAYFIEKNFKFEKIKNRYVVWKKKLKILKF